MIKNCKVLLLILSIFTYFYFPLFAMGEEDEIVFQKKCKYFNGKPGSCRYGEKCKFSHVKETPEEYRQRKEKQEADYLRRQEIKQKKHEDYLRRQEIKQRKHEDYLRRQEAKRERERPKKLFLDNRFSHTRPYKSISSISSISSFSSGDSSYEHPRIGDRDSWTGAIYKGQQEIFGSKCDVWETSAGSPVGSFCPSGWSDS